MGKIIMAYCTYCKRWVDVPRLKECPTCTHGDESLIDFVLLEWPYGGTRSPKGAFSPTEEQRRLGAEEVAKDEEWQEIVERAVERVGWHGLIRPGARTGVDEQLEVSREHARQQRARAAEEEQRYEAQQRKLAEKQRRRDSRSPVARKTAAIGSEVAWRAPLIALGLAMLALVAVSLVGTTLALGEIICALVEAGVFIAMAIGFIVEGLRRRS